MLPQEPGREAGSASPLGGAVRIVAGLTLVSRFAGLARDLLTVRVFGDSAVGSAFAAAFAIPNLFRRLFGEGALAAAFLPEYSRVVKQDPEGGDRFASLTIALLVLATGAALVVAEAAVLVLLVALPDEPDRTLSLRLILLMLPFMPLVCTSAILGGMLQVHGRFGPTAAAPIILNVFIIGAGGLHFVPGGPDARATSYIIGVAAVVSGVAQVAWSVAALRPFVRWTRVFAGAGASARRMFRRFVPVLVGLGTLQLNSLLDTLIAMWPIWVGPAVLGLAYPLDAQSNVVLFFTQRLYQFPLGVFGIAVATAVFPLLAATADHAEDFADTLRRGVRLSMFIGLPASAGLMLVRTDLIAVMYSGGSRGFSGEGVARASAVLLGYAPCVWAYSLNHVFARAFYARGDTKTPMKVAVVMVLLNLCLNVALIWPLREAGLAWSTAVCAFVQCVVLGLLCRGRLGGEVLFDGPTVAAIGRTVAMTALMSLAVVALIAAAGPAENWIEHAAVLIGACVVGAGCYGVLALVTRTPELRWLTRRT